MSQHPTDLKYTKTHEWLRIEGNRVTIGITDHAQEHLGDLVFVELPDVGRQVTAGEEIIVIESVKAAADVYAPIAGEVVEINEALNDSPELINEDPFNQGWIVRLDATDIQSAKGLLDAAGYQRVIESEDE